MEKIFVVAWRKILSIRRRRKILSIRRRRFS